MKLNGALRLGIVAHQGRAALVEGAGLAPLPSFLARPDLDAGRIVPILLDWKVLPEIHIHAVNPHRRCGSGWRV